MARCCSPVEKTPKTMLAEATEEPMADTTLGGTLIEQRNGGLRLKDALHV